MNERTTSIQRRTTETDVTVTLTLYGTGKTDISTGIGFLDHLLTILARHACWDLELRCAGDLPVDDHHTAEDCALVLGTALDRILSDRRGIVRFGASHAPLDEALCRGVVDLSGRPYACINLGLQRHMLGRLACENVAHFLQSFAMASRSCLHVTMLAGENDHHRAEAAFKALALALRQACAQDGSQEVPSTKGVL